MTTNLRKFLSLTTALVMTSSAVAYAEPSAELIEAAKKEGMLTTIALRTTGVVTAAVIDGFKKKYPEITVNELNRMQVRPTKSKPSRPTRTTRARRLLTLSTSVWLSARR